MRKLENSRVLITGGAGFIGSNLAEVLLEQGNQVVCMDNFINGKRENIEPFLDNPAFTLIEEDIRDFAACRKACENMEYVLHQAALGSVPRSIEDPISSTEVNISGFVNVLFAAHQAGVKRFVYAASSSTYGDSPVLPKREDDIGKPLSPYAVTKYVNELYAEIFSRIYGIETIGLRYFNVFGKCQDPAGDYAAVIPKFASSLIRHQSPLINGDGSYSRDFTYIDNVVQVNQLAALVQKPDAINTVYNVACGERTTLNELFTEIRAALAEFDPEIAKITAKYGPERTGDIPHSQAAIDKARELLDYRPHYGFKEGLHKAAEWYFKNLV